MTSDNDKNTPNQPSTTTTDTSSFCDEKRYAHWPHAAERARELLDVANIEAQATRILARGLRTRRLVAFVGAGASMSYGRLTWTGLMNALYDVVDLAKPRDWEDLNSRLWPKGRPDFLREKAHALKSQILSNALQRGVSSESQHDRGTRLQAATSLLLSDFHGFADLAVWRLLTDENREAHKRSLERFSGYLPNYPGRDERQAYTDPRGPSRVAASDRRGLAGALDALKSIHSALTTWTPKPLPVSADVARQRRLPAEQDDPIGQLLSALVEPSIDLDSPLRHLIVEWGVRRYITTNYDREIERSLEALDFHRLTTGTREVHANQYEVLNFGRAETGAALRFGLEGPRRHAAVLHIHGDVEQPESLIITEEDYQRLYLEDHPTRDLVTNATLANFAANPMLFVGSDVNEDDVLRPMRQFMSGPGHRRDRMAVALFLATRPEEERNFQKIKLLLQYGVHAIHVGNAKTEPSIPADKSSTQESVATTGRPEMWLRRYVVVKEAFDALAVQISSSQVNARQLAKKLKTRTPMAAIAQQLRALENVLEIEGVPIREGGGKELDINEPLKDLVLALNAYPRLVSRSHKDKNNFALRHLELLFETTTNRIMSNFLCAKLMALREKAVEVLDDDSKLALPYQRPALLGAQPETFQARHAVALQFPEDEDTRFKMPEPKSGFDEGIEALAGAIEQAPSMRRSDVRRIVLVCAARGAGKGGQFDRLAQLHDGQRPALQRVLRALGHVNAAGGARCKTLVLHINLSFSNEIGTLISQLIGILEQAVPPDQTEPFDKPCKDQLERLRKGIQRFAQKAKAAASDGMRLFIILGNAGVLFDAAGRPKNGQISRVMRLLLSPRLAVAPIDILMYVGESQVPESLREAAASAGQPRPDAAFTADLSAGAGQDGRPGRRLDRLNIRHRLPESLHILVHPLGKTRVSDLANAYFPKLAQSLGWSAKTITSDSNALARQFYFTTGGNRFAQTLLLAYLEGLPERDQAKVTRELLSRLSDAPAGSVVEATIEAVLDGWAVRHRLRKPAPPEVQLEAAPIGSLLHLIKRLRQWGPAVGPSGWQLATELLWHLAAFSHPVEAGVLASCPQIQDSLKTWSEDEPELSHQARAQSGETLARSQDNVLIGAWLELLTHWCLIFRVEPRPLPCTTEAATPGSRYRYAPHRHMQRHFVRLMGGRNVESTHWDQFTTSTYASQPDESPSLRPEAHRVLTEVVQTLTRYPIPREQAIAKPHDSTHAEMLCDGDRIRAAYALVRSSYSLGVVSHLAPPGADSRSPCGHMENYRRLVRWVLHAARYWETHHAAQRQSQWCVDGAPVGLFYPGELVWLYNECGVISLAQGKLNDAEQLLSMAELAARKIEGDDSGSLHTRIRIHSALVQIERGRPQRARQILLPIAARSNGHPVPPLLAQFYLGLLAHIGGSYRQALAHYETALAGLRAHERSRATAFVLMGKADLMRALKPAGTPEALTLIDEAIGLAQQGGHEDLRILAILARVRLCIEAQDTTGNRLFERLSIAQQYATSMDIPRIACEVHELRARLLLQQGEYRLSAAEATASLEIAALYDLKLKKARGLLTLAQIYQRRGEMKGARELVDMGKEIAASADYYACVRDFKELELAINQPPPVFGATP